MIETVVSILLILIPLGMIAFKYLAKRITEGLTGYMTEKGKNLATKEDIEEITEKVEGVKSHFTDRTEKLRSDLSADIQRQMNLFVKRNEALTQFFEDSFTVVTFLRTGFHFRYEDVDGLDTQIRETQARIVRAITSYQRLMLYVREESILTPAYNAATALGALHRNWFGLILAYRNAFVIEADEWELAKRTGDYSFFPKRTNDKPSDQAIKNLWQVVGGTVNTLDDSVKAYTKAVYSHFHPADDSKALATTTGDSLEK